MTEKQDIRVAVVGGGYWGKNLVRNFAELGALDSICDTDPNKLDELARLYPDANVYKSFKQVLSNPSVYGVVIATPAVEHYSMAKQALQAGKDVLVEKPLALTVEQGEELAGLAAANERVLMVGHILEYHPAVQKLVTMVREGRLGKIQYIYSNRLNLGKFRTEENILWSFAPHDISVILRILDETPNSVITSGGAYLNDEIADVTVTCMNFTSGVKGHIYVSWLHPYKEQKLVVVGSEKMAVFDDVAEDKLLLYSHQVNWLNHCPVAAKGDAEIIEIPTDEPLKQECKHFINCIRDRQEPLTSAKSGLEVLRVLDASQRSLMRGSEKVSLYQDDIFIHPSSVVEQDATIGSGTRIWHFSHVMPGAKLGDNCNLGQNVFIGSNVQIGNNVKIQNNVSVYEGVVLEDDVFCGPSTVFTNIKAPRSAYPRNTSEDYTATLVKKGASIGANATIVCGVSIGENALVGAGAVVTRDIPDNAVVYGSPSEIHGWSCKCGSKVVKSIDELACSRCNT